MRSILIILLMVVAGIFYLLSIPFGFVGSGLLNTGNGFHKLARRL